jgi:hypothetical protein
MLVVVPVVSSRCVSHPAPHILHWCAAESAAALLHQQQLSCAVHYRAVNHGADDDTNTVGGTKTSGLFHNTHIQCD